ncbi:hypothetical protein TEQG_03610 [Trichophyton equinum CBS 127.97]|uniref:Uncharacterized protein n=1 Tax=Trichophyton equinum (strain ATCC MYA-4606 / CBS 127.97) TaxID=559882 RepID=F2PR90_TRIEC|nr:hypothetical protein TEQG_03610 [Trichophyton equinum CBS 127.97]
MLFFDVDNEMAARKQSLSEVQRVTNSTNNGLEVEVSNIVHSFESWNCSIVRRFSYEADERSAGRIVPDFDGVDFLINPALDDNNGMYMKFAFSLVKIYFDFLMHGSGQQP